mgnify:CR=1 FL=1
MKTTKILSILMAVLIISSISSCKKKGCTDPNSLAYDAEAKKDDESCTYPTSAKKAIVFKTTATWCSYCADWGTTYANNLSSAYTTAKVIAIHSNDNFSNTPGDQIRGVLPSAGTPHFYVGTESINNNYSLITSAVDSELAEAVEVSMAMENSTNGSAMNVRVQSQWLGSTSGEYFLAVYVVEDGQVYEQNTPSGYDQNFVHDHVLRAEGSDSGFGKAITVSEDGNMEEFDITLNASWVAANCYPIAVLWKKNGSSYDFINMVY